MDALNPPARIHTEGWTLAGEVAKSSDCQDTVHGYRRVSTRILDAGRLTDTGGRAKMRARYWAVDEVSVPMTRDVQEEDAKRITASTKRKLNVNPVNARYRFA
jgi:hypothetical protein